jgi:hypothetical protein
VKRWHERRSCLLRSAHKNVELELTLGNRGQVKRRVHARTRARTHARAHPPIPPSLPPPTPPPPPTESAPKTFLPLLSPQTTAFFTSVLSLSGFVREPRCSSRTRRPGIRSFAVGLLTTGWVHMYPAIFPRFRFLY